MEKHHFLYNNLVFGVAWQIEICIFIGWKDQGGIVNCVLILMKKKYRWEWSKNGVKMQNKINHFTYVVDFLWVTYHIYPSIYKTEKMKKWWRNRLIFICIICDRICGWELSRWSFFMPWMCSEKYRKRVSFIFTSYTCAFSEDAGKKGNYSFVYIDLQIQCCFIYFKWWLMKKYY